MEGVVACGRKVVLLYSLLCYLLYGITPAQFPTVDVDKVWELRHDTTEGLDMGKHRKGRCLQHYRQGHHYGIRKHLLAGLDSPLNQQVDKAFELGPRGLHVDMLGTRSVDGGECELTELSDEFGGLAILSSIELVLEAVHG
jgi:hypothetical protein